MGEKIKMGNEQEKTQLFNDFKDMVEKFKEKLASYKELRLSFAKEVLHDYKITDMSSLIPDVDDYSDKTLYVKSVINATSELWGLDYTSELDFYEYDDEFTKVIDEVFTLFEPTDYFDECVFKEYQPLLETANDELTRLNAKITKAGFQLLREQFVD